MAQGDQFDNTDSLEANQGHFRALVEHSPFGAALIDTEGRYRYINPRFTEMFGYTLDDFTTGRQWFRLAFPDQEARQRVIASWLQDKAAGRPQQERPRVFPVRCKDGTEKQVHFRPVELEDGSQIITYEDVTAEITAEEALTRSQQTYQALSDASFEAVFISDTIVCLEANRSATEMFGYSRDELLGFVMAKLFTPEHREPIRRKVFSGYDQPYEVRAQRKDGSSFPVQVRGKTTRLRGREYRVTVIRDLTDRYQAMSKLETMAGIVNHMPLGIIIYRYDPPDKLIMLQANPEALSLTGLDPEESIGREFRQIWDGEEVEEVAEAFLEAVRGGKVFESGDLEYSTGVDKTVSRIRAFPLPESRLAVAFEDITSRKETQQALTESERFLRTLFDSSLDAIVSVDSERRITGYNQAFMEMYGYGPGELDGKSVELLHNSEESFREFAEVAYGPIRDQGRWRGEWTFRRKDGRDIPVELVMARHCGADDRPTGYVSVHRDITERRKAEARLKSERDRAQHYLDVAGVIFVAFNAAGEVTMVNRRGQELLGYAEAELVGRKWVDTCLPAEARREVREVFDEVLAGRLELAEYHENEVLTKSGERRIIAWHNSMLRDRGGDIVGILSSGEDLTERRRSEEQFARIFDMSLDMISIADINTSTFLTVNPAFTRILGYSEEELLGKPFTDFIHPEDVQPTIHAVEVLQEGDVLANFENRYRCKDGRYVWLNWVCHPLPEEGVAYAIARDTTEQKKAELDRQRLEQQLRQAQKMEAIGTLAGGIAHDFNNVLSAIIGYTELARKQSQLGKANEEELDQVLSAAERAARLVKRILTFSRKVEPSLQPLDLNREVRSAADMLKRTIPKMIQVEVNLDPEVGMVRADPGQIEQVILNLGANARDAMPAGGRLAIETSAVVLDRVYRRLHPDAGEGPHVMITVTDTGEGIKAQDQENIFDPFFTTKEVGLGTGLGLAIVFGIVKSHRGHITCYSEEGLGTTFRIYLPAMTERQPSTQLGGAEAGRLLVGDETIMVVDDEPAIRGIGKRLLEGHGYQTLTAASGEEALEIFRDRGDEIDLVILDVSMPGMGGLRCLQELRALRPEVRVIISSGYARNGSLREIVAQGDVQYLAKPFGAETMLTAVRRALDH